MRWKRLSNRPSRLQTLHLTRARPSLIPAYATTIRPPFVLRGCIAIFDGGLSGQGSWRIELKAVDDIRQHMAPQLAHLAAVIDECRRNADLDHATATRLVLHPTSPHSPGKTPTQNG